MRFEKPPQTSIGETIARSLTEQWEYWTYTREGAEARVGNDRVYMCFNGLPLGFPDVVDIPIEDVPEQTEGQPCLDPEHCQAMTFRYRQDLHIPFAASRPYLKLKEAGVPNIQTFTAEGEERLPTDSSDRYSYPLWAIMLHNDRGYYFEQDGRHVTNEDETQDPDDDDDPDDDGEEG
jgi:hypothetical protein